jgi:hypothetical protein
MRLPTLFAIALILCLSALFAVPAHDKLEPWGPLGRTDYYFDDNVSMDFDERGNGVAVWESYDPAWGKLSHAQGRLRIARSTDGGATWSDQKMVFRHPFDADVEETTATVLYRGNGEWILSWVRRPSEAGTHQLLIARSYDGGTNWSKPQVITEQAIDGRELPARHQLEQGADGKLMIVYVQARPRESGAPYYRDLWGLRSVDGGETWTSPARLFGESPDPLSSDGRFEFVHLEGGTWVVAFIREIEGLARGHALVSTSYDDGATWTAPRPPLPLEGESPYLSNGVRIATDGQGTCALLANSHFELSVTENPLDPTFVWTSSTDGGLTWGTPVDVPSYGRTSRDRYGPGALHFDDGRWLVAWPTTAALDASPEGELTMAFAESTDDGATWTSAKQIFPKPANVLFISEISNFSLQHTGDRFVLAGTVEAESPAVVPGGMDRDLFFSTYADGGTEWEYGGNLNSFGQTVHGSDGRLAFATDGDGLWCAVWETSRPWSAAHPMNDTAGLYVARSFDDGVTWTEPTYLAEAHEYVTTGRPVMTTDRAGNWMFALYDPFAEGDTAMLFRSTNNGGSWTSVDNINFTGQPTLVSTGANSFQLYWSDVDAGSGTPGETDLMFATTTNGGASWSTPTALNSDAASDDRDDRSLEVTMLDSGNGLATWKRFAIGTDGVDSVLMAAATTDGGASWSNPVTITAASVTGEPDHALDADGRAVVVWSTRAEGPRYQVLAARSADGGTTWGGVETLFDEEYNFTTVYAIDPRIVTDGADSWEVTFPFNGPLDPARSLVLFRATSSGGAPAWTAEPTYRYFDVLESDSPYMQDSIVVVRSESGTTLTGFTLPQRDFDSIEQYAMFLLRSGIWTGVVVE